MALHMATTGTDYDSILGNAGCLMATLGSLTRNTSMVDANGPIPEVPTSCPQDRCEGITRSNRYVLHIFLIVSEIPKITSRLDRATGIYPSQSTQQRAGTVWRTLPPLHAAGDPPDRGSYLCLHAARDSRRLTPKATGNVYPGR